MYQKVLKRLLIIIVCLLAAAAGLVYLFDPFFHYHEPIGPLKAVATKKEYQVIGKLRNFDYDSVIVGSSTAENFNNRWFDETFGVDSVKIIKSSGVTAQLDYYLQEAFKKTDLKYVFYSLDLFALEGDPDTEFPDESMPLYLYDRNPINDVKYLWNKDVIFEDIPYMAASTFLDDYDEGTSYNWAQYKVFSKEQTMKHYIRPLEIQEEVKEEEYKETVDKNISILENMVKEHPETEFIFFYPPYSFLWWDYMTRTGLLERTMYETRTSIEKLIPYENVKMYYFHSEEDIIMDLDLYMDHIHFNAETNHWMVEEMYQDNYRLTVDNYSEKLDEMWIITESIKENYDELIR